jgi:hypothetical protein
VRAGGEPEDVHKHTRTHIRSELLLLLLLLSIPGAARVRAVAWLTLETGLRAAGPVAPCCVLRWCERRASLSRYTTASASSESECSDKAALCHCVAQSPEAKGPKAHDTEHGTAGCGVCGGVK